MARFQTELDNLQQQQKEAIDRLQVLEADSNKLRELILKLQGAIEAISSLNEREEQQSETQVESEIA